MTDINSNTDCQESKYNQTIDKTLIQKELEKKINQLEAYAKDAWQRLLKAETTDELTREKHKVAQEMLSELKELATLCEDDETEPTPEQYIECMNNLIKTSKLAHQEILAESLTKPIKKYIKNNYFISTLFDYTLSPVLSLAGKYFHSGNLGLFFNNFDKLVNTISNKQDEKSHLEQKTR